MKAKKLKCNNFAKPNNIETPVFEWELPVEYEGIRQIAYRIQLKKNNSVLWDSGKKDCSDSIHIEYEGPKLESDNEYCWRIKFWTEEEEADWSDWTQFETGLFAENWLAKWIGYDKIEGEPFDSTVPFFCADDFEKGENQYYLPPVPYFRKEFYIKNNLKKAKLYISAFGLVDVYINGRRITENGFAAGFSNYDKTVYSKAFDIKRDLQNGANAIGILLGDGWYAGYIGLNNREWYGSKTRMAVQIELLFEDGEKKTFYSDKTWKASYGALQHADIMQGEYYNAMLEQEGWDKICFDDREWDYVNVGAEKELVPEPYPGVPIVEHERLSPKHIEKREKNKYIIDFGKCFSGVVSLTFKGNKGSKVTVQHAEMLVNNELHLRGNRSAQATDIYVLNGNDEESFCPRFTYHGFRYAEIKISGDVKLLSIEAVVLGSELPDKTEFSCSNDVVNNIFQMVCNTQQSNQFEIPTDCNARDERLGWGMEGNHFLHSMTYMNNNEAFIEKWLKDIWDGQGEDGSLQAIAPPMQMKDVEQFVGDLQSNSGIHMLYVLYKIYGNTKIIKKYLQKTDKYFEFLKNNSDRNIRFATSGDWLGIWEKSCHTDLLHGYGECSPTIIGTAHYAVVVKMMREMCAEICDIERVQKYDDLFQNIKHIFQLNFIQRDGTLRNGKQGEYIMALYCGFFPKEYEAKAVEILKKLLLKGGVVRWYGGMPTTPYFLETLQKYGLTNIANRFLVSTDYPSLGYMQKKGATTLWERWDAIFEDGNLHPQAMNAMNHIGIASVAKYLVSGLVGIETVKAGFKKIKIMPSPSKEITSAYAKFYCPYGKIISDWKLDGKIFDLKCEIPANTTAEIIVPFSKNSSVEVLLGNVESISTGKFKAKAGKYHIRVKSY